MKLVNSPVNIHGIYEKLPERYREIVETEAGYASIRKPEKVVVNGMAAVSVAVVLTTLILPYSLITKAAILVTGLAIAPPLVPYLIISIAAEKRRKEIENVLPDALLLISANMKSGLNIEKAFLLSARDEFGPLAEELRQTAMEMFGGKPVEEALGDLESRVKSGLFQEALKLLIDGLEAGGNTAKLLESSANDIRNSMELQEEINSNIRMYVIFIMMAAVVGAPLLFSISVHMSQTTANMWDDVNLQDMSEANANNELGITFQQPDVNTAFFEQFSIMAIIAINFFAGLIISEIKNANIKEGAKYIPVLIIVSVTLFFIMRNAVSGLVGGFV